MKRFMQILCIAVGLMLVVFLAIQNTDAKTDKKSRAEFTEGLSGWSIDDLENLQSALLWPDS